MWVNNYYMKVSIYIDVSASITTPSDGYIFQVFWYATNKKYKNINLYKI